MQKFSKTHATIVFASIIIAIIRSILRIPTRLWLLGANYLQWTRNSGSFTLSFRKEHQQRVLCVVRTSSSFHRTCVSL